MKTLPVVNVEPLDDNEFILRTPYNETVVKLIRGVTGVWWNKKDVRWHVPMEQLATMCKALRNVPHSFNGIVPPPEAAPERPAADLSLLGSYQFKTVPYKHQREIMALGIEKKTFAILAEMGTGKTKATIDIYSYLMACNAIDGMLIVCPKAVMYSWAREIAAHSPLPEEKRRVAVLMGSTSQKLKALEHYWHTAQVFVANYEAFLGEVGDAIYRLVASRRMMAALDESTRIKTHSAQTSKRVKAVGPHCEYRYILTGTPITQGPLDAFSQFGFLDTGILGHHNYYSFKAEYAITGGFKGKEIIGYKNLERMQKRILPWSYRVLKVECLDLPPKMYQVVEVDCGEEQRELYRQMRDESIIELDGKFSPAPVILTKLLRLQQITSGFLPLYDDTAKHVDTREFPCPKHDAVVELVEQALESNQKVIIWCRFIFDITKMYEKLTEHGAVVYYGETNDTERQKAIDSFQTDATVRVFIGQIQTGGLGITLTAGSVEIYASNSFTLSDRLQSEDRAHRIGQKKTVTIIDVVTRKTVDDFILKTLNNKKNLADVITGDNLREAAGDA